MNGYDANANTVRSRYDYYYSISSPSLSQATNYFDNQASLFGEPIAPLLPPPTQKSSSPQSILTPLTPFNSHISSSSSASVGGHTNFTTTGVHPSLIETFDNHLYESIRKNILNQKNNNQIVTDDLTRHHVWTQFSTSSNSTQNDDDFDGEKRASTSFGFYKNDEKKEKRKLGPRQRTLSAFSHNDMRKFNQISSETVSDTDNNNVKQKKLPKKFTFQRNKTNLDRSSSSSSKLNHTVAHVDVTNSRKPPLLNNKKLPFKRTNATAPYTMVKSKSDLISIKTYPESFTIVASPRRSPSAGISDSKRRKKGEIDVDEDSIMDFEWVKPTPAKLLEAAQNGLEPQNEEEVEESLYITDALGQHVSIPTTPILTDKVMVGSSHRVHAGTVTSHKKQSFAIINDYKNRRTRLLQHRHSEENMVDGRFSPYTRYCLQRELSAPTLNRLESFESDDGEFYYYFEDDPDKTANTGRQTSIGFVHKKSRSSSMMNLSTKKRPKSEMQKSGPQYASTPNFININKRAVIQSIPMEKINPRLILHRSLKGVLKIYNNTNIQKRTFSLDDTDIVLANGKIDPKYLAPMPIPNEDKRSGKLTKQQEKSQKKRVLVIKRRKLSPIAGTPSKESEMKKVKKKPERRVIEWTPKRILNTPMKRLEQRLKKDKFGRLITEKKAPLPDFKNFGKKPKKKKDDDNDDDNIITSNLDNIGKTRDELDERDQKAINFMQQLQARNSLGRALLRRREAKQPPPLTRQPSKQSIESLFEKDKPPPLKKKNSKTSLKSVSASIKTVGSMRSSKNEVEDEEAEAGDEITKLHDVKGAKKDAKSKIKGSMKILSLGRVTSASSTKSQKDSAPPPSRTGSKTSILSMNQDQAQDTPSRKSEILRAPSAASIMSMTTAAITANPLNTTLAITNQLASQGAEILERKQMASVSSGDKLDEMVGADADRMSMSSQKTVSSQKTNTSKAGSRKTSAKSGTQRSRTGSFIGAIVSAHQAVKLLSRKKSTESIRSEKSDATQITIGPGHGADNKDSVIAGKVLEHSQRSLEKVQKTVDKATHEIHQTINEKLSDLKTLEKKLSKKNLLEHDANNNDVENSTSKSISRHSTKHDLAGTTSTTLTDTGTMSTTNTTTKQAAAAAKSGDTKSSTMMMKDKDRLSVNAISVAPDNDDEAMMESPARNLEHQESEESNESNSSTSSSMNDMRRKRCWGLSSCCDGRRSESAQMMINERANQPQTKCQKCKSCMCAPFDLICRPFKRRKTDDMEKGAKKKKMKNQEEKPKWWEKVFCCCGCCRRCTKKGREEHMKKKEMMSMEAKMHDDGEDEKKSCWSRLNCFKCFFACCCCSRCCRKRDEAMMDGSTSPKPNETPGTCTRMFCFCCLCCRESDTDKTKRPSMTSQESQQSQQQMEEKGNCCSRFCTTLFCCCCKKQSSRDSRRTSMLSKKQSLAPTLPPPEDKKPKLEMVLVEHASLMKGAIPVLPLCLAYFLLICNIIIPGSGTILSGVICLCIGIPRFSQHDGARGRIGSFIINCIVGVSQAFTVIFCFVGWGWSIWWGSIMIHLAKRQRKLRKAEMLRQLDAEKQAAEGKEKEKEEKRPAISRGKSRDVERGIN